MTCRLEIPRGTLQIYRIFPGQISPESAATFLTAGELDRASRFRFSHDRERWVGWRSALREILGRQIGIPPREVPIILSELGKPLLAAPFEGLHFNLSHCDSLALVAVATEGPLGIDLEPLSRAKDLLGCETGFCHPLEIRELAGDPSSRALELLRIWCAKEAVLKSIGTGFLEAPEKLHILFDGKSARAHWPGSNLGILEQQVYELIHPSLVGFQSTVATPWTVRKIDWQ